jgi:hypothetical protein
MPHRLLTQHSSFELVPTNIDTDLDSVSISTFKNHDMRTNPPPLILPNSRRPKDNNKYSRQNSTTHKCYQSHDKVDFPSLVLLDHHQLRFGKSF